MLAGKVQQRAFGCGECNWAAWVCIWIRGWCSDGSARLFPAARTRRAQASIRCAAAPATKEDKKAFRLNPPYNVIVTGSTKGASLLPSQEIQIQTYLTPTTAFFCQALAARWPRSSSVQETGCALLHAQASAVRG